MSIMMLLGYLANDLIMDYHADVFSQHAYYCSLLTSFQTVSGKLRLLLPCLSLTVGILSAQSLILLVVAMAGLPLLVRSLILTNEACQQDPKHWISGDMKSNHGLMFVLFMVILGVTYFEHVSNQAAKEVQKKQH